MDMAESPFVARRIAEEGGLKIFLTQLNGTATSSCPMPARTNLPTDYWLLILVKERLYTICGAKTSRQFRPICA
jgi:hypothetical protein